MGQKLRDDTFSDTIGLNASRFMLPYRDAAGENVRITIGGQQYRLKSNVECDLNSSGYGGLDTGLLTGDYTTYYVYAVLNNPRQVGLVSSLSAPITGPSGFNTFCFISAFKTDSSAEIGVLAKSGIKLNDSFFE